MNCCIATMRLSKALMCIVAATLLYFGSLGVIYVQLDGVRGSSDAQTTPPSSDDVRRLTWPGHESAGCERVPPRVKRLLPL